jgi:SHS family lactate transporter-like MFS transporter
MEQAPAQSASDHKTAVLAGFLGWTLDAFDYFLVVLSLTAIGESFNKSDKQMAIAITLTLAFRPIGALIFGALADRYGRRIPLMINLVFYSIIEVLSGFAPNFTTFLILRALFGIGMGGEWGVGASLVMEKVPPRLRGVLSGLLQEGYATGYLLAAICYFFVLPKWGWRPMFFIGGLPALLAIFVRVKVKESEVWQKTKHDTWGELGKGIASHWRLFLYLTLLMMMMNFVSHGTQDIFPTFLKRKWSYGPETIAIVTAISMVGAIIGGLVFGRYSDHVGRRRALITALILAIVILPLPIFSPTVVIMTLGAFCLQFMVQGAWGVIPAHINELSPDSVRGFLPGFAYQCGVAVAGSIVYMQAALASHIDYRYAFGLTALAAFIFAAIVAGLGRERKGITFGES